MTLLVTVDTARRIIMVSDRRVTVPRRHGGFAYIDDEWNKAVVVTCPETQFGAVFAGLAAFVKRTPTGGLAAIAVGKHTSAVIHSSFQRILDTTGYSDEIFLQFAQSIGEHYRRIGFRGPDYPELTIFCHGYHMTRKMFAAVISNKECIKRKAPGQFDVEVDLRQPLKHGRSKRACRIRTYGTGSAKFNTLFLKEFQALNRIGYFNRVDGRYIERRIVQFIRRTADDLSEESDFSNVGKDCMSITLFKANLDGLDFSSCYYPYGAVVDRPWHTPLLVYAHGTPPPPFSSLIMSPWGFGLRARSEINAHKGSRSISISGE